MTHLALPSTFMAYRNPATRTALEWIAEHYEPPNGLTLSDLREYHALKLAHEKLRFDLWCFLEDMWRSTWGAAMTNYEALATLRGSDRNDEWSIDVLEPTAALDSNDWVSLSNHHRLHGASTVWTTVYAQLAPGGACGLSFQLHDGAAPIDRKKFDRIAQALADNWEVDNADSKEREIATKAELVTLGEGSDIDLSRLVELARDAIAKIEFAAG